MENVWTSYDEKTEKIVSLREPELVTLANGQKAVMGENTETDKLSYIIISPEDAKVFLKNRK